MRTAISRVDEIGLTTSPVALAQNLVSVGEGIGGLAMPKGGPTGRVAQDGVDDCLHGLPEFSSLIDDVGHCLVFLGMDRCIEGLNCPMAQLLSVSPQSYKGVPLSRYFHAPAFDAPFFERLLAEKRAGCEEVRPISGKLGYTSFLLDAKLVERNGSPSGFLCLLRNRTAQFETEERLHEQAEILNHARDAIFVLDFQNRVVFWNPAAELLYSLPGHRAVGRPLPAGLRFDSVQFSRILRECVANGHSSGEMRQISGDGTHLLVSSRWSMIRNRFGDAKHFLIINSDVTEKNLMQEREFQAQRLESIGAMAGGIAHDMNNILHPVSLSLQILMGKTQDPENRQILQTVTENMDRAIKMTRQILSFARGTEGEWVRFYVEDFLSDVEHFVRIAFPKNIRFECIWPGVSLPLSGNPTQLYQALLNLCVNARDAMPEGGSLVIRVDSVLAGELPGPGHGSLDEASEYVHIEIADSGPGIPQELQEKVFAQFFSTKPRDKGTGLGLSTAMQIIQKHGGILNLVSSPDQGTIFHIYLPSVPGENQADAPAANKAAPQVAASNLPRTRDLPPSAHHGRQDVILVVDDEPSVLTVLKIVLEKSGFCVAVAGNGLEALAKFGQMRDQIRILITDIAMPGMSGLDLIRSVQKFGVPVDIIATTGMTTPEQMQSIREVGVSHVLSKPCSSRQLLELIHSLISKK